jgi:hypothetical protein
MFCHGLKFLPPWQEKRNDDDMMTNLSFNARKTKARTATRWKDEDLPLLMLYGMKRSTAKETNNSNNNSSGHILSISIEREYDGQLLSFLLSAEKLNGFLVGRTADTTTRVIKSEEKETVASVVSVGGTANSAVIRAISEMSQLFQVSSCKISILFFSFNIKVDSFLFFLEATG